MGKNQEQAPLFSGLQRYLATNPVPFHVPGHKGGKGMDLELREFLGGRALSLDLTNIIPLDDLHQPHSLIKEAQLLAAEAFGSDHAWFSVQGTTTPIMAMIMAVCSPGDKIIMPRNIHRSALSGLILSGAKPIFLEPFVDPLLGIHHPMTASQVAQALRLHPDARGVFVINPTYYGFAGHLAEIVRVAHAYGVPVLVDEAHGSHLHFHPRLPLSAMEAGADIAATSVHKLGGSLTQSSILNLKGNRISPRRVQAMLNTLTTTSASFLLLASLDAARRHLALHGKRVIEEAIALAEETRYRINAIPGLWCPGAEMVGQEPVYAYDPTKLIIFAHNLGLTGRALESRLSGNYGVEAEFGDLYNVLCLITSGDDEKSVGRLLAALRDIAEASVKTTERLNPAPLDSLQTMAVQPKLLLTPREAFYASTDTVLLHESIGRIVAEWIMTYPPGIPLILPGEIMDQAAYNTIRQCQAAGLTILGTEDDNMAAIRVVRSEPCA